MYYLALCKFPIICTRVNSTRLSCIDLYVYAPLHIAYSVDVATYSTALHLIINYF